MTVKTHNCKFDNAQNTVSVFPLYVKSCYEVGEVLPYNQLLNIYIALWKYRRFLTKLSPLTSKRNRFPTHGQRGPMLEGAEWKLATPLQLQIYLPSTIKLKLSACCLTVEKKRASETPFGFIWFTCSFWQTQLQFFQNYHTKETISKQQSSWWILRDKHTFCTAFSCSDMQRLPCSQHIINQPGPLLCRL